MSNFEINIKQTQTGSSIKDASKDLASLKTEADQGGKTVNQIRRESEAAGEAFKAAGTKLGGLRTALDGLATVGRGNLRGLVSIVRGLGTAIGLVGSTIGAVGAASFAAKVGFDKAFSAYFQKVYDLKDETEKAETAFKDLDAVTLTSLAEEIQKLSTAFSDAMESIDAFHDRLKQETAAKFDLQLAKLRAEPESPERDKKIADVEREKSQTLASDEIKASGERLKTMGDKKRENDEKIAEAKDSIEQMRKDSVAEVAATDEVNRKPLAKKRKKELEAKEKETAKTVEDLERDNKHIDQQMEGERSRQKVQMIGMAVADVEHGSKYQQIDEETAKKEKEAAKKKAKEELEAELAAIEAKIKAEKDRHELEDKAAQANIGSAEARAQESFRAASAFSPDKRLKVKAREIAQAHDVDLDLRADADNAKMNRLLTALNKSDEFSEAVVKAFEKQADSVHTKIKNLNM